MAVLHLIDLMARLAPGSEREGVQVIQGAAPELDGLKMDHWEKYTNICIYQQEGSEFARLPFYIA